MFCACIVRSISYRSGLNWKMGKDMLAGSFASWSLRYLDGQWTHYDLMNKFDPIWIFILSNHRARNTCRLPVGANFY